jgi:hypothetical protein
MPPFVPAYNPRERVEVARVWLLNPRPSRPSKPGVLYQIHHDFKYARQDFRRLPVDESWKHQRSGLQARTGNRQPQICGREKEKGKCNRAARAGRPATGRGFHAASASGVGLHNLAARIADSNQEPTREPIRDSNESSTQDWAEV